MTYVSITMTHVIKDGSSALEMFLINRIEIKKEPIAVVKHIAYCLWEHSERQFLAVCKKYIFV